MNVEEDKEEHITSYECGSSLAEREFGADTAPPAVDAVVSVAADGDSSSSVSSLRQHQGAPVKVGSSLNSIDDLRAWMAADVVKDDGLESEIPTFLSPFTDPSQNPHRKKAENDSNSNNNSQQQQTMNHQLQVPLVYCDQTASNRPLASVESYLTRTCLPLYGNTHTSTTITGSQSTAFCAEARQIVAESTNAKVTGKASLDVVLFAGHGTTSAVELLIDCLGLHFAAKETNPHNRPVVFIGPFEHHSNMIPWRESGCEIVMVPECAETHQVDLQALDQLLQQYRGRFMMGTFTAASNVTGKVCDVDAIAATLHRHGALAFFDYATAAPYLPIDMNPVPSEKYPSAELVAKDAIFLSPHKMLGGVGTPGVLVAKKHLVSQTNAPARSGGGTVFYVTHNHHRFLSNRIERYEGGTPNVTGVIRAGLTFLIKRRAEEKYKQLHLKAASGPKSILEADFEAYKNVSAYLREHAPNLVLLGDNESGQKLPIFSFLVRFGSRFLHFNYVCAVMNDVFGIQSRGGCQCSGPYSQRLMGLTETTPDGEAPNERNQAIEKALLEYKERAELLRPGYTRLSLPFKGLRPAEVEYVKKALVWVSKHAWALMCQYRCNHRTGEWRHWSRQGKPLGKAERRWLGHFDFVTTAKVAVTRHASTAVDLNTIFEKALENADALLAAAKADMRNTRQALKMTEADIVLGAGDDALEELRWYVYPKEVAEALSQGAGDASSFPASEEVLGALDPLGSRRKSGSLNREPDEVLSHREQKPSSDEVADRTHNEPVSDLMDAATIHYFRDGEHTGEATMDEIRAGINDGELSECCLFFDNQTSSWLQVESFLTRLETQKSVDLELTKGDNLNALCKKANRDKSSWGTGTSLTSHAARSDDVVSERQVSRMKVEGEKPSLEPQDAPQKSLEMKPSDSPIEEKKARHRHKKPPQKIMRLCTQALIQWDMIQEGDRLLLGLSGGKDSLSLLHVLLEFQRRLPVKFELEVCTIDPMTPSFDPSPLIPYVESLGLKYHYIREDIIGRANTAGKGGKTVTSLCAFCARMKRGNLYECARRNNCNKLVLAQHLDDCAESFMMSVMHNGFLRTMKANYKIDAGDLSVIRPMVYCRESLMTDFAKSARLPVINENCPACFEEPKERARVKKLLSREETLYPNFYDNIRRALIPLMHDDTTAILRCYTEETLDRSRKENHRRHKRPRPDVAETNLESVPGESNEKSIDPNTCGFDSLKQFSEDDLVRELARRKAEKHRVSGAKRLSDEGDYEVNGVDMASQVCTLNGGPGTIPCYELME